MTQADLIITFIVEGISTLIAFILAYKLRFWSFDKSNKARGLIAIAIFLSGLYTLFTLVYGLIAKEWAIKLFLKLGMISVFIAVFLLFISMKILINSSIWLEQKEKNKWILLAVLLVVYMSVSDFIEVVDEQSSTTNFDPLVFIPFAAIMAFLLLYSMSSIYKFGIKKTEGEVQKRMKYFFAGLTLLFSGLVTDGIGNSFPEAERLFDLLLFSLITFAMILIAMDLIKKK